MSNGCGIQKLLKMTAWLLNGSLNYKSVMYINMTEEVGVAFSFMTKQLYFYIAFLVHFYLL